MSHDRQMRGKDQKYPSGVVFSGGRRPGQRLASATDLGPNFRGSQKILLPIKDAQGLVRILRCQRRRVRRFMLHLGFPSGSRPPGMECGSSPPRDLQRLLSEREVGGLTTEALEP